MKNIATLLTILGAASILFSCGDDDNANGPVVPATQVTIADQEFSVDENSPQDFSIGTVQATTTDGVLEYEISNQSVEGAITINSDNGELTVANPDKFDYEENPIMTADVQATADGESTTARITINLNDLFNLEEDVQALQRILDANPNNTLGWDLTGNLQQNFGLSVVDDRVKAIWFKQDKGVTVFPDVALYNLSEILNFMMENNDIEEINFPAHSKIESVEFNHTKLTTLDVSMLSELESFVIIEDDNLTSVNVANGNNVNMTRVILQDDNLLDCVTIDSGFTPGSEWNIQSGVTISDATC